MTRPREHWTTQDLELYHDQELDACRQDKLSEALRHDSALRDRLAAVYRVDDCLRTALTDQRLTQQNQLGNWGDRWPAVLAAASLLIAATAVAWYAVWQPPSHNGDVAESAQSEQPQVVEAFEYHPIRVVFSLPVRTMQQDRSDRQTITANAGQRLAIPGEQDAGDFLAQLDRTLRGGRVQDTLRLLDTTSEEERSLAYRHIGQLLRSAQVAEEILDLLSPREQLAVCSEWARKPALRPVVFTRLRHLLDEPGLSDAVQVILTRLAKEPALRIWLRGYQLVQQNPTGEHLPS